MNDKQVDKEVSHSPKLRAVSPIRKVIIAGTAALLIIMLISVIYWSHLRSQQKECYYTLNKIWNYKITQAEEEGHSSEWVPKLEDLEKYWKDTFLCPSGGDYSIKTVNQSPECSVHGRLPWRIERTSFEVNDSGDYKLKSIDVYGDPN